MLISQTIIYSLLLSLVISTKATQTHSDNHNKEKPREKREEVAKPEAFVTVLFGSGFELGVRVLGQSIRESGTRLEYVVMATHDVPQETIKVLIEDGWKVKMIDKFDPGVGKFDGTINKMQMWRLTEYRRVLWIDADAILLKNVDHLVRCGNFCAAFRHSDTFNSGIMVMKPSLKELSSIMELSNHFTHLPGGSKDSAVGAGRYIWGDQNLLNEYYDKAYNLKASKLFDENDETYHEEPMRLPEGYNTDLGVWIWNGEYTVESKDMYIIHYTAGPVKPHLWWTYPLFDCNWEWLRLRKNLPSRYNDPSIWELYNWIPLIVIFSLFCILRFVPYAAAVASSPLSRRMAIFIAPDKDSWIMALCPTIVHLLCYYWAYKQIPSLMWPGEAWFVYGMWVIMFLVVIYAPICYMSYMSTSMSTRISARAVIETVVHVLAVFTVHLAFAGIVVITTPVLRSFLTFLFLCAVLLIYEHFVSKRILRIWYHYKSTGVNDCDCII